MTTANSPRPVARAFAMLALLPSLALGAEFAIIPLRVDLDRNAKSAEVTVRNDDASPLRMQVEAMGWRQDDEGVDRYEPAEGLIYFPRAMEIPPGESRIVRVGVKGAPVSREETYRVFIEELPGPQPEAPPPQQGTSVKILLRVGVPVFVAPAQPERKSEIAALEVRAGRVAWSIANRGNVHFRAEKVELTGTARDGRQLFAQQFQERYFLAGVTKNLQFEIPPGACPQLAMLEATVTGDSVDLKRKIDVDPRSCR